jgi:hypothetical protein
MVMKEARNAPAKTRKSHSHSTHQNRPHARLQHGEQAISMAMVNLLSGKEAGAMLSDTFHAMRVTVMRTANSVATHLYRNQITKASTH